MSDVPLRTEQRVDWRKPPRGMWAHGSSNVVDFRDYSAAVDEIERLNQQLQRMTERKEAVNETLRLVVEERNRLRETLAVRDRGGRRGMRRASAAESRRSCKCAIRHSENGM